jgi:hypothetical protein
MPVPTTHQRQFAPIFRGLPGVMVLYRVAPALAQLQRRHSLDLTGHATSPVRMASLLVNPNSSTSSKTTTPKTISIRTTRSPLYGHTKRVLVTNLSSNAVTGVRLAETAEQWEARKSEQRDSGVSNTTKRSRVEVDSEIKAFPLVCVCMPQHWRKTIEGDSTDTGRASGGDRPPPSP